MTDTVRVLDTTTAASGADSLMDPEARLQRGFVAVAIDYTDGSAGNWAPLPETRAQVERCRRLPSPLMTDLTAPDLDRRDARPLVRCRRRHLLSSSTPAVERPPDARRSGPRSGHRARTEH